jgi:hypothetical protein
MPLYRIAWSIAGQKEGCGKYCLTYEIAEAWIEYLRKEYRDMTHTIEVYSDVPAL